MTVRASPAHSEDRSDCFPKRNQATVVSSVTQLNHPGRTSTATTMRVCRRCRIDVYSRVLDRQYGRLVDRISTFGDGAAGVNKEGASSARGRNGYYYKNPPCLRSVGHYVSPHISDLLLLRDDEEREKK